MLLAALCLATCGCSTAPSEVRPSYVDLNAPLAIEDLQTRNPEHYRKVTEILSRIESHPPGNVPQWLRVNFDAQDGAYGPALLVSLPPKRRLSFVLDGTRYEAFVVVPASQKKRAPVR